MHVWCICVHVYTHFSQSIGMLHLVGLSQSHLCRPVSHHICVSYILGRQSQVHVKYFGKIHSFRLDNFLCLSTLVGNKLTQACTLPAGRDALGAVLTYFLACSFPEDHSQDCDLGISGRIHMVQNDSVISWLFKGQVVMYMDTSFVWQIKIV